MKDSKYGKMLILLGYVVVMATIGYSFSIVFTINVLWAKILMTLLAICLFIIFFVIPFIVLICVIISEAEIISESSESFISILHHYTFLLLLHNSGKKSRVYKFYLFEFIVVLMLIISLFCIFLLAIKSIYLKILISLMLLIGVMFGVFLAIIFYFYKKISKELIEMEKELLKDDEYVSFKKRRKKWKQEQKTMRKNARLY